MDCDLVIKNLKKRGFSPAYFESVDEAVNGIFDLIPTNSTIGFGGSTTVKEIGLAEKLKDRGNVVFYRGFCDTIEEKENALVKMHTADWFICSTNALCVSGDLVNIDGRANRVAEMLYGPKNILIICGTNKIVDSIEDGIERTRNVAAPKNCVKLNKKTPCSVTGICSHCNSPDTICKATVIQHHPTTGKNVYIIIVNQNLGY